ncbi:MAG: TrpB-like pyridoxal phosphate-dependent enzyme, partial [Sulfolobales archaeon]
MHKRRFISILIKYSVRCFYAPMDLRIRPSIRASQREDLVPEYWYNILPDLPKPLPPPRLPDGSIPPRSMFERLFPKALVDQEMSSERYIKIPYEVRETLIRLGRPTPLIRAVGLERFLGTPARIYYKYEGALPTGSHKINTAVAQIYYNKIEGIERVSTETGAGQWGSALALAGALFSVKVRVFMVRSSYNQKPYRRVLMELYGAEVIPSPSTLTRFGKAVLEKDPDSPGSLGIAISEAIEDVLSNEKARYSLGSVLNHVLLHQTIIGLEARKQLEEIGEEEPDYVVGSVGGGSNFAGLSYPFIHDKLKSRSKT